MSTGEGENPREGQSRPEGENRRGDHIGVGAGDDSVARIQLAARWAEGFATEGDSLGSMLRRFRAAYEYLDAVIHGVEPPELDSVAQESRAAVPAAPPQPAPPAPPPWSSPTPQEPGPPAPPEQRPWG